MVTELQANTAEVARAEEQYMEGADGLPVQDDLDARVTKANATHAAVTNAQLGTSLHTANHTVAGASHPVYTGANVVTVASPLVHDSLVRTALDADQIFHKGGQIPPTDFETSADLAPYLDMLWLAQASKQTGEKLF